MKLSNLRQIMRSLPAGQGQLDPQLRNAFLRQMGLDPGSIYQELEMESRFIDSHQDVSYANAQVNLHSHNFYELLYCCNNCGAEYLVGTERYRLQTGDVILIPPGMSHRPLLPAQMPEPYRRIVLWISPEFIKSLQQHFSEAFDPLHADSVLLRTAGTRWEWLGDLFHTGLQIAEAGGQEQQLLLVGNTITLLAQIRRAFLDRSAQTMQAEKPELLDRLMAYIEANLPQKITLAELAHHFFVSESTISQTFRKKMGISFHRYVTQRRLITAKTLIERGLAMEEVSLNTGFSDYSAFYRAFKQEFGICPRHYRNLQSSGS